MELRNVRSSEDIVKEKAHVEVLGGRIFRASLVWNGKVLSGVSGTESGARASLSEVLDYRRHFDKELRNV